MDEMINKIIKGIRNPEMVPGYCKEKYQRKRSEIWCSRHTKDVDKWGRKLDEQLWDESREYGDMLESTLQDQYDGLATSNFHEDAIVGGGAAYRLLYFLTRLKEPDVVVETGVAAGWSSRAILDALHKNGSGQLFSNDLPYAERPDKQGSFYLEENNIGVLVEESLRDRWHLSLGPDRENLPEIIDNVDSVDMVHYDSDKSYEGRKFAMKILNEKLHKESIVLMDDIVDNMYFKHHVENCDLRYEIISSSSSNNVGAIYGNW